VSIDYLLCLTDEKEIGKPQIIFRDSELTLQNMMNRLNLCTNMELARIAGAIEGITNARVQGIPNPKGNGTTQTIQEPKVSQFNNEKRIIK